jgi:hypothetical protein
MPFAINPLREGSQPFSSSLTEHWNISGGFSMHPVTRAITAEPAKRVEARIPARIHCGKGEIWQGYLKFSTAIYRK